MKNCIVFGNGKSLENFDFKNINRNIYDIVGLCLAFRYWEKIDWYPDIYICVDTVVLNNHELVEWLIKDKCKKYLLSNCILKNEKLVKNINMKKIKFIEDLRKDKNSVFRFINTWCSGSSGLLFSMDYYKNIKLFGFDCDYIEFIPECKQLSDGSLIITKTPSINPNYFFNDYQREGDKYNVPNGKSIHLKSWYECSKIIEYLNKDELNKYYINNYNSKKSISEYFYTDDIIKFNNNNNIAVIIPVTSNKSNYKDYKDTDLFKILFKSFFTTYDLDYNYKFYLGIDSDDIFYQNINNQNDIKRFINIMKKTDIEFISIDKIYKGNVCHIWNALYKKAYDDNYDYFLQIGSDIYFQDKNWINECISVLKDNIGVVGMTDMGRKKYNPNDKLLTQTFVNRKHMDIFGFYYPPEFKNWYIDNWISEIYELYNKKFIIKHRIYNCGGEPRYNIYGDKKLCDDMIKKYKNILKNNI
mgnify:CR=1 FL=1